MLRGLAFIAERTVVSALVEPGRARNFDRQTSPFLHTTRSGLKFHLSPGEHIDRFIAKEGIYERRLLNYLKRRLPEGAVMLDVGANIGNHAIYLAEHCSQIHCFEPNPTAGDRLHRNINANGLTNVTVHPYGLGDEDATLTFHENITGNLGASCFADGEPPEGWQVKTLEIKEAAKAVEGLKLSRLDFIKLDVEGMEEVVIRSLRDMIAHYRPLVAFEHYETRVAAGTFDRIRACFPDDYRIMEAETAPEGSIMGKIAWNLRHDGGPRLVQVTKPEVRPYEALLAEPVMPFNPRVGR